MQEVPAGQWRDVPMPATSHFVDFEPPSDALRWNQALMQAARGEQVLLERVLRVIRSPTDLFESDKSFKWLHRVADFHKSSTKEDNWLTDLSRVKGTRAPVVMLGYRKFEHDHYEGPLTSIPSMGPGEIMRAGKAFIVPRRIVAVGNMDENWGWLSTYFLNRTVPWALSFDSHDDPFSTEYRTPQQQVQDILDNDNIVALVVSQHHNISHPKVISLPLGLEHSQSRDIYTSMMRAANRGLKKDILLFSAGSNYAYRPAIRACIAAKFPSGDKAFVFSTQKMAREAYRLKLLGSMASVAMPGLGACRCPPSLILYAPLPIRLCHSVTLSLCLSVSLSLCLSACLLVCLCLTVSLSFSLSLSNTPRPGYDTYRLWESLAAGAMPVVERGMGMDRTLYRLPVLLLDDYDELTPALLRQAYVEALYRADDWEYERMTRRWWERLIFDISYSGSIEPLLHFHPMRAEDTGFTVGGAGRRTETPWSVPAALA